MNISSVSEPELPYARVIDGARSKDELVAVLEPYALIAYDALLAAAALDDWDDFKTGLRRERKGHYAGDEWATKYGAILMPEIMMRVSIIAEQYKAPWGTAYIRLVEAGRIKEENGQARWSA